MHCPAVLEHRCALVHDPSARVHHEEGLRAREVSVVLECHAEAVEDEEDDELGDFDELSGPGHDEAVLVEEGGFARVVEGDWLVFIVVGKYVEEGGGSVDYSAAVDL